MPGGVARTSTFALNNVTLPFALRIADKGYKQALLDDHHLRNGLNVYRGKVTYKAVADDLGYAYEPAGRAAACPSRLRFAPAGRAFDYGLAAVHDCHKRAECHEHLEFQHRRTRRMTGTAKAIKHIENERVIVTEYRFAPGANTGWHRHGHDYVVVPLMDGRLKIVSASGETFAEMKQGAPYFRNEGVEHDVINANEATTHSSRSRSSDEQRCHRIVACEATSMSRGTAMTAHLSSARHPALFRSALRGWSIRFPAGGNVADGARARSIRSSTRSAAICRRTRRAVPSPMRRSVEKAPAHRRALPVRRPFVT